MSFDYEVSESEDVESQDGGSFWDSLIGNVAGGIAGQVFPPLGIGQLIQAAPSLLEGISGVFGGGGAPEGGTTATPQKFDPNRDEVLKTTILGDGSRQIEYRSAADGQIYRTTMGTSTATGTAARPLSQNLGGGRIATWNPTTNSWDVFEGSGTASSGGGRTGGGSAASAKPQIINLGGGRYLAVNPNGSVEERSFGGGETGDGAGGLVPPALDPQRSQIVNYLQALLGQNKLPYSGVAPAQAPSPSPALAAPALQPAPALGGLPPVGLGAPINWLTAANSGHENAAQFAGSTFQGSDILGNPVARFANGGMGIVAPEVFEGRQLAPGALPLDIPSLPGYAPMKPPSLNLAPANQGLFPPRLV